MTNRSAANANPRKRRSSPSATEIIARTRKAVTHVKVGRPLSYSPELCEVAVALGIKGKNWSVIAREFGIGRKTLYEWARRFPTTFARTVFGRW